MESTLGRQIQEGDAVCDPDIYFDEREQPTPCDGQEAFGKFLTLLHNESASIKSFSVLGYAALWHLNNPALNGATQKEVARIIGVNHQVFNRAVKHWAFVIGTPSQNMRLRDGSAQAFVNGRRRDTLYPCNPFSKLDTLRAGLAKPARSRQSRWQLTFPFKA